MTLFMYFSQIRLLIIAINFQISHWGILTIENMQWRRYGQEFVALFFLTHDIGYSLEVMGIIETAHDCVKSLVPFIVVAR